MKKCSCSRQYGKFFLVRLFSFQVGIFLSSRFVPEDYDRICFENQDKNLMQTSPFPQTTAGRKASNKSEYGLAELTDLHKWFLELTLPSMQVSWIVKKKICIPTFWGAQLYKSHLSPPFMKHDVVFLLLRNLFLRPVCLLSDFSPKSMRNEGNPCQVSRRWRSEVNCFPFHSIAAADANTKAMCLAARDFVIKWNIFTGFSSEIGTKLRESAVGQAGGSCYSWAALSSNDSKTLYIWETHRNSFHCQLGT